MKNNRVGHHRRAASSKTLGANAKRRKYLAGEVIYSQGDPAGEMFRIEQGYIKLAVASSRNKKSAITILREGDCFGQGCLVGVPYRAATATSIQESTISKITRKAMMRRLAQEPPFAKAFILYLLNRIVKVEDDLADQQLNSSERRLARLLMQLSDFDSLRRAGPPVANVDQGTLAQVVGTTRSRVSHFMNGFREKGLINYNGDLQVHEAMVKFLKDHSDTP